MPGAVVEVSCWEEAKDCAPAGAVGVGVGIWPSKDCCMVAVIYLLER